MHRNEHSTKTSNAQCPYRSPGIVGFFAPLILGFFCVATTFASDFQSPRTLALGGAGHAGPSLNDSIYLNPSNTSFQQTYGISMSDLRFGNNGRNLNISVQDGRSEFFQAGVGYTRKNNLNILTVGASKSVLEQFGIGLSGKFLYPSTPGSGQSETVRSSMLSMTFAPSQSLQFAAIADNLFESDTGKRYNLYREFILGSKLNLENILTLYFDPHWTPSLPQQVYGYEAGAEVGIFKDFFLRVGKFKNASIPHQDGVRGQGYSFGAGWLAPKLSLDFAMSHDIEPVAEKVQTLGATVFF